MKWITRVLFQVAIFVICSITEHIHIFFLFWDIPNNAQDLLLALYLRYCSWQPDTHTVPRDTHLCT